MVAQASRLCPRGIIYELDAMTDFRPTASLDTLRRRAAALHALRQFLDAAGYWEVDTPLLSGDIVVDAHLDPFIVPVGGRERKMFLQTSPEFAMKRLLAAGADAIYQIGKVFRTGESGRLHNPEFTMAEWYRVGDDHHAQMDFTEQLVRHLLAAIRSTGGNGSRPVSDFGPQPFERLRYDAAFERHAGQPVLTADVAELQALAKRHGLHPPESLGTDRDGWLNYLFAELIQPRLGHERPAFLLDFPATQAALAVVRAEPVPVAERFELFVAGVELCNGYHELIDPVELRRRAAAQNRVRTADDRPALPEDSRLLAAMEHGLPACSGVALGFDRLFLLASGHEAIADVIAFPFERA
jgi:lysyl-tRNA synthetase class 2